MKTEEIAQGSKPAFWRLEPCGASGTGWHKTPCLLIARPLSLRHICSPWRATYQQITTRTAEKYVPARRSIRRYQNIIAQCEAHTAVYLVGGVQNHQPLQVIAPASTYPGAWQAVQFGEVIALNRVAGKQQVIAVQAAYPKVLAGKSAPRTGHILQP